MTCVFNEGGRLLSKLISEISLPATGLQFSPISCHAAQNRFAEKKNIHECFIIFLMHIMYVYITFNGPILLHA